TLNRALIAAGKRLSVLEAGVSQALREKPAPPIDRSGTAETSRAVPSEPLPDPPDPNAIDPFVLSWAAAWERQDVKGYLSHYSRRFEPEGGIRLAVWYKQREKRILRPSSINIDISNIQGKMRDPSRGKITFVQMYRSETYMDQVTKTLDIQWEDGAWKIVRETSN
ncbi:MAG: hypothetical protein V3S89_04450, partial [Desulfobacterales bacterium]